MATPGKAKGTWQAWLQRRVIGLAVIYLMLLGLLLFFERWLVFPASRYPEGDWDPPNLAFEDVWFEAEDGTKLHGWYVPRDNPRGYALYAHGNGGNLSHRWGTYKSLTRDHGLAIFAFDYRGYGRSEGSPNEAGILADGRAAQAWLARRASIPPDQIILMGESLGGAVAIELASTVGARVLVLEKTFTSLPDVAAAHLPIFPIRWLMRARFDSASKIGRYKGPLFQVHGDIDGIVPFDSGRRLFEAANEPKRFLVVPGQDHNDALPREYHETLESFLREQGI